MDTDTAVSPTPPPPAHSHPNTHTVHLRDGHKWHVQYRDFSVIMLREDIVIRVAQGIHGSTNTW